MRASVGAEHTNIRNVGVPECAVQKDVALRPLTRPLGERGDVVKRKDSLLRAASCRTPPVAVQNVTGGCGCRPTPSSRAPLGGTMIASCGDTSRLDDAPVLRRTNAVDERRQYRPSRMFAYLHHCEVQLVQALASAPHLDL